MRRHSLQCRRQTCQFYISLCNVSVTDAKSLFSRERLWIISFDWSVSHPLYDQPNSFCSTWYLVVYVYFLPIKNKMVVRQKESWQIAFNVMKEQFEIRAILDEQEKSLKEFWGGQMCRQVSTNFKFFNVSYRHQCIV